MDEDGEGLAKRTAARGSDARAGLRVALARHWLIVVLVAAGAVLRGFAWFGYQPALLYGDSFRYLDNIGVYSPEGLHPIGYDLLVLTPILAVAGLASVAAVQHLAVLAASVALYALALRHGARRWLAALAAAPLLLDAYQVQIEQMIMSDTWLQVSLVALLWLLLARGAPRPRRAAVAGLLLGVAVLLRLVAASLVVPVLAYLLVAGGAWRGWRSWRGWRVSAARSLAMLAMFAAVVGGYSAYFNSVTGYWGLSRTSGDALYGRTATIADCERLDVDPVVRLACPEAPVGQRRPVEYYAHIEGYSPEWAQRFPPGTDVPAVQRTFGGAVVRTQPLEFAGAVAMDFLKGFRPQRTDSPGDVSVERWHFRKGYHFYGHQEKSTRYTLEYSGREPTAVPALAGALRGYQLSVGYTPGTILGLLGVVALLAGFGLGKARSSGIRSAALLSAGMALAILLASAAFEFSWRYQLPGLVLLPFAGVLGIAALRGPLRRPA